MQLSDMPMLVRRAIWAGIDEFVLIAVCSHRDAFRLRDRRHGRRNDFGSRGA